MQVSSLPANDFNKKTSTAPHHAAVTPASTSEALQTAVATSPMRKWQTRQLRYRYHSHHSP